MFGLEKSVMVVITVDVMAPDFFGSQNIVRGVADIGTTLEMILMESNGSRPILYHSTRPRK
jgi:hypothetical protein